jgi:hypothetical protein
MSRRAAAVGLAALGLAVSAYLAAHQTHLLASVWGLRWEFTIIRRFVSPLISGVALQRSAVRRMVGDCSGRLQGCRAEPYSQFVRLNGAADLYG